MSKVSYPWRQSSSCSYSWLQTNDSSIKGNNNQFEHVYMCVILVKHTHPKVHKPACDVCWFHVWIMGILVTMCVFVLWVTLQEIERDGDLNKSRDCYLQMTVTLLLSGDNKGCFSAPRILLTMSQSWKRCSIRTGLLLSKHNPIKFSTVRCKKLLKGYLHLSWKKRGPFNNFINIILILGEMQLTQKTYLGYGLWLPVGWVPFQQLHYQSSIKQKQTPLSETTNVVMQLA